MSECPECNSKDVRVAIHTDYKECNKCFHFWEESDKNQREMKTKVVHSQSKNAWNVVNTELGGKYKIARIPYSQTDDDVLNTIWKYEALEIAVHISKSMETFNTKER